MESLNETVRYERTAGHITGFNEAVASIARQVLPSDLKVRNEDGTRFSLNDIAGLEANGLISCTGAVEVALRMSDQFEASVEKATVAKDTLIGALNEFKSRAKNDLATFASLGERIRGEMRKVDASVATVTKSLTSPEFVAAVENAERLVAALAAIDGLKSARMTFAVVNQELPMGKENA